MKGEKLSLKDTKIFDAKGFWLRLWRLLEPSHKQIRFSLVLVMAKEIVKLGGPYLLKIIIDELSHFTLQDVYKFAGLIIAMLFSNQLVSFLESRNDKRIIGMAVDIQAYLSNSAHRKMMFLDLGYHEKENTGNKISKIQRGTDRVENLFTNFFFDVAPTIFQLFFTTIVLFAIDWRFGLTIMVFVPIFVFLTLKINKLVFPMRIERHDRQEEASGEMAQSIININTVKSFVQEERETNRFSKITERVKNLTVFEFSKIVRANLKRNLVIDSGRAIILAFGAFLVFKGGMTIGSLVFVYTISEKALISLYRITRLYDRIMDSSEAVDRLYGLSIEEPDIKSPVKGLMPNCVEGKVEFEAVDFCYRGSKIKALNAVNLKIRSGCVTALVGPSGGGKSTLARMIYRHYDPTKGKIMLDDKDLRDYDLYALRRCCAIVPQDVEIFNTTVKDNIAYAKPNVTLKEIKAAAKIANADEFIIELKEGYNTIVGERGIKLSGGQRQRIGIARAVLANPRILIFDEATSHLDSYSEKLIQEAMDKIRKGRTVIIIAHRLSTIKKADKIVVLEKGKVVEEGSHFELAKIDGGLYQRLLNLQNVGDIT